MQQILEHTLCGRHLSSAQAEMFVTHLLGGGETHQAAATLALLRSKGETAEELLGMAKGMMSHALTVEVKFPVLDIVGTGGDGAHTVNISTAAALLTAACGIPVAKHGNRAVSSACGSADFIEALGIPLLQNPEDVCRNLERYSFGFMFAPSFHPALQQIATLRKKLKIRTVFNLLGPLLNPARAQYRLIGVCDEHLVKVIAETLMQIGVKCAFVFHGSGLDEITPIGPSNGYIVNGESISPFIVNPQSLGVKSCTLDDLRGGSAECNIKILKEVFEGKTGPIFDAVALNAACGLFIYGAVISLSEGYQLAHSKLKSGGVIELLKQMESDHA